MKRGLFLLIACLLPGGAWAIHPATTTKDIDDAIRKGNSIQFTIDQIQGDLSDLDGKKFKTMQDLAKIGQLEGAIKGLQKDRDIAFHQAIKKALVAYGLAPDAGSGQPAMPTGTTVHPKYKGRHAEWIVVYNPDPARSMLDNSGRPDPISGNPLECGRGVCGQTGADGVTVIYGTVRRAGDLAVLLYHEQLHFEQFTTAGQGDKLTRYNREINAWQATYDHVKEFGLPVNEENAWLAQSFDKKDAYEKEKSRRSLVEKLEDFIAPTAFGRGESPRTNEELAAIRDHARELDAQYQRKAQERADQARRQRSKDATLAFAKIAKMVCDDPNGVTQDQVSNAADWIDIDKVAPPYDLIRTGDLLPDLMRDDCRWGVLSSMVEKYNSGYQDGARDVYWLRGEVLRRMPGRPMEPPPVIICFTMAHLSQLASLVCDNPDAITQDDMAAYLCGFPYGRGDAGDLANKPPSCEKDLFMELVDFNRTWAPGTKLRRDWLIKEGWQLKKKYSPPQPSPQPAPQPQPSPDPDPDPDNHHQRPIDPRPPRPTPNPWQGL